MSTATATLITHAGAEKVTRDVLRTLETPEPTKHPKQTLTYRGESLLSQRCMPLWARGVAQLIVVTGAHAELARRELDGLEVMEEFNPLWETGMASSVRAGVRPSVPCGCRCVSDAFLPRH